MRRLYLKSPANSDYTAAVDYFEKRQAGLGREFEQELENLFERIKDSPQSFPRIAPNLYNAILHRFKYKICFAVEGDEIGILAIYHPSRDPDALRRRF
jgi:plasmid stabilization system protein ParE